MNLDKYKLTIWITLPRALIALGLLVGVTVGLAYIYREKKEPTKSKKVESWASDRYHFVRMRSMTDEVYTMICDRHTGIESLLAKAYRYPSQDSRDGGNITSMTSIHMGFNPDCLGRDIQAYDRRGRLP